MIKNAFSSVLSGCESLEASVIIWVSVLTDELFEIVKVEIGVLLCCCVFVLIV